MTHLSLEASKKIFDLIGDYETEQSYSEREEEDCTCGYHGEPGYTLTPRPNLGEALRLLPKIGEKKGWVPYHAAVLSKAQKEARGVWHPTIEWVEVKVRHCADLYAAAPSPEEGMKEVSKYLLSII